MTTSTSIKLFFVALTALMLISAAGPGNLIYHDSGYKLRWKDFKGPVEEGYDGYAAVSYVGFRFGYTGTARQDSLQIVVEAFFNSDRSWHKSDTSKTILQHEQVHFDISELYSRKLKEQIAKSHVTYTTYQKSLQDIEKQVRSEMNKTDSIYDASTDHGLIKAEQEKWNTNIAADLETFKVYERDTFNIPVHLK